MTYKCEWYDKKELDDAIGNNYTEEVHEMDGIRYHIKYIDKNLAKDLKPIETKIYILRAELEKLEKEYFEKKEEKNAPLLNK